MKDAVYQVITDRVIALLEQGTVPWQKPWRGGDMMPRNLISHREYRGVNVFLLHSMGYGSPYWLTFKQAQELGGHVRKGERACPVVFWKWLEAEDKDHPGSVERIPLLRYYHVFNVGQCDGLEAHVPQPDGERRPHNLIADAEQIVAGMPSKPEVKHGLGRAFYSPSADFVGMPDPERFETGEDYYSVLFHELSHATGHPSRLDRKGIADVAPFGSHSYSKEELVAEMGAAFLCGQAGIVERTLTNSAAYVQGWLVRLRNDVRLVVQAATQAQKAADFILGMRQSQGTAESEVAA